MRLTTKVLLSSAISLGALLLFPELAFGQTVEPLMRLDNSACPAAEPSALRVSVPDSVSGRIGAPINESPDIVLLASVHADQVKFASKPDIRVRLCWGGDSVRVIERTNLPSPVVPGTTYRNVFINLEILGHVNAACLASKISGQPVDTIASAACAGLSASVRR
jgi:hypothetical protein